MINRQPPQSSIHVDPFTETIHVDPFTETLHKKLSCLSKMFFLHKVWFCLNEENQEKILDALHMCIVHYTCALCNYFYEVHESIVSSSMRECKHRTQIPQFNIYYFKCSSVHAERN